MIEQIWQRLLEECLRIGYKSGNDETILDTAYRAAYFYDAAIQHNYLYPGIAGCLTRLSEAGILQGIISNAQFYTRYLFKWFLDSELKDLGIDPELVFYSYRFEVAKPTPMLFQMAAEKLQAKGISPSCVLYLGNDMLNDIYPAKTAGFQTALFAGDKRSLRLRTDDPRCKNLAADLVITDLIQLIQHIQSNPEKANHRISNIE